MRALSIRSVRPRVTSSGVVGAPPNVLPVRQAVFPPGRRKLTFNDAFTILLAPVFAAAFVADTTLKDRRRKEWEKRISEVREEIEQLQEKDLQKWTMYQTRSVRNGALSQRRTYSTSTLAVAQEDEFDDTEVYEDFGADDLNTIEDEQIPADSDADEGQSLSQSPTKTREQVLAWQRYESLVAAKMALEMIIYTRTGRSMLNRQPDPVSLDSEVYPESLDDLVAKLQSVKHSLRVMGESKNRLDHIPWSLMNTKDRQVLSTQIRTLSSACKIGHISTTDLAYEFAHAVTNSNTSPHADAYRSLIEAFSMRGHDTLTYIAMGAMQISKQTLTNSNVGAILHQHGKFKDGKRFDRFLKMLVQRDSVLSLSTRWELVEVNGVYVSAPVTGSGKLLIKLINSALQCSMPHKAEAWATILFQGDHAGSYFASAIRSILLYCAENNDWRLGEIWMKQAIRWLAHFGRDAPFAMSTIIGRILDLCIACDKVGEYEEVLQAALDAAIHVVPAGDLTSALVSDRWHLMREDWTKRIKALLQVNEKVPSKDTTKQAAIFQKALAVNDRTLSPYVGITNKHQLVELQEVDQAAAKAGVDTRPLHSPNKLLLDDIGIQIRLLRIRMQSTCTNVEKIHDRYEQFLERSKLASLPAADINQQLINAREQNADLSKRIATAESTNSDLLANHHKLARDFANLESVFNMITKKNQRLEAELQIAQSRPQDTTVRSSTLSDADANETFDDDNLVPIVRYQV